MKKLIVLSVIVIAIAGGFFIFKKKTHRVHQAAVTPTRGTIAIELRLNGSVAPRNRLEIKPQVAGRIENILVNEGQKVRKGEIIAWMSSTDRSALLDAVRSKGEEEMKKWEDIYKPTPIIAPLDGFIINRDKEPGQSVALTDNIVVMADKLIVTANVDETDLRNISLDQKVRIQLDAYPDRFFSGTVEHIAYESQVINNVTVYEVKIRPDTTPPTFRAGMTATIQVTSQKKDNVLLLPVDAISYSGAGKTVTVRGEKPGERETITVETGISDGKNIEIVSGIDETDRVLLPEGKSAAGFANASQRRPMGGPAAIFGGGRKR